MDLRAPYHPQYIDDDVDVLGYPSPNDFKPDVATAVSRPNSDGGLDRETGHETFPLGESEARNHPERLHDLSTMEKALLTAAVVYFCAAGHSPQLSTQTGLRWSRKNGHVAKVYSTD